MNSIRTEQNAINYSASRCPACRFGYHHFKLSRIDSHRPSYQLYLCIVDLQSLCINAISVTQRTHQSAPSAVGPHLKATEVSLAKSGNVMHFKSYSQKIEQQGVSNSCIAERQSLSSCPWPFSRLCATWKGWNCENTFAHILRPAQFVNKDPTMGTSSLRTPEKLLSVFTLAYKMLLMERGKTQRIRVTEVF